MRHIHKLGLLLLALALCVGGGALGVRGADEGDGGERKKVTYRLDQFKYDDDGGVYENVFYSSRYFGDGIESAVICCPGEAETHMIHPEEMLSLLLNLFSVEDSNPDNVQYTVNGNAIEIEAPERVHQVVRRVMQSMAWASQKQIKLSIETVEVKADVVARKLGERPELFNNAAESLDWLQTVKTDANTTDLSARLAPGRFETLKHNVKSREYIAEYDVQVATMSCIYDPVVDTMDTGLRASASIMPYEDNALMILELCDARLRELRTVNFCTADEVTLELPDMQSYQTRLVAKLASGQPQLLAVIPPAAGGDSCLVVTACATFAPPESSVAYRERVFALQPDLVTWANGIAPYLPGWSQGNDHWGGIGIEEFYASLFGEIYVEDAAADCGVENSYSFGVQYFALVGEGKSVESTRHLLDTRYQGHLVHTEITGATLLARNQEYKELSAKEEQVSFALLGSLCDNAQEKDNTIRPFFIRTQLPQASFAVSTRDVWYITDYDVQVATASNIYDPIVGNLHLPEGFVCDTANVQDNYVQGRMLLQSLDSLGHERMTVRLPLVGMDMMDNFVRGMAGLEQEAADEDGDAGGDGQPAAEKEAGEPEKKEPPVVEYEIVRDVVTTVQQDISVSCSGVSRKTFMEAGEMVQGDKQKLRVVVLTHCKMKR